MKKKKFFKTATPYFFILPWIVGFLVFTLGPLILSLIMSFFDWPLTGEKMFVGLGNYMEMFTKDDQVLCAAESDHGAVPGDADYSAASWRQSLSYDFLYSGCYLRCSSVHYLELDSQQ